MRTFVSIVAINFILFIPVIYLANRPANHFFCTVATTIDFKFLAFTKEKCKPKNNFESFVTEPEHACVV